MAMLKQWEAKYSHLCLTLLSANQSPIEYSIFIFSVASLLSRIKCHFQHSIAVTFSPLSILANTGNYLI